MNFQEPTSTICNSLFFLSTGLCRLVNLKYLSLSGNKLVVLPEWLGSMPKLQELVVDNNLLQELPNRLTLAPALSIISVRSNQLTYLPLNGFLSSPSIRFDLNPRLNYLSLPVLCQLSSKIQHTLGPESRNVLEYEYIFKSHVYLLLMECKLYIVYSLVILKWNDRQTIKVSISS